MESKILMPIYTTKTKKKEQTKRLEQYRKSTFRLSKHTLEAIKKDFERSNAETFSGYLNEVVNQFKYIAYSEEARRQPDYNVYIKGLVKEMAEVDENFKTELISFRVQKEVFETTKLAYNISDAKLKQLVPHIIIYHGLVLRKKEGK